MLLLLRASRRQDSSRTLVRLALLIAEEPFMLADPKLSVADRLTYPERTSDLAPLSMV